MYVVAGVLAVLLIVLVLEFFLLRNKLNRLYRKYMYFMKSAEGGSIEVKLSTEVREHAAPAGTPCEYAAPVFPEDRPCALRRFR